MTDAPLRFGVIGTGPWARFVHLPAAASSDRVELTAVWGRDAGKAMALADDFSITAHADLDALLDTVDAVGFAVPPAVQGELALRAARAGKRLLLDKPVATTVDAARAVEAEANACGLVTAVFFTQLWQPEASDWIARARARDDWTFGRVEGFSNVLVDADSPYAASPWRHERGALWDLGPHAVALLATVLGRVTEVSGARGPGDLSSLVFAHEGGAQGTASLTMDAAPDSGGETFFLGPDGRTAPPLGGDAKDAYRAALDAIAGSTSPAWDVGFGRAVVEVLVAAERAMAEGIRVCP